MAPFAGRSPGHFIPNNAIGAGAFVKTSGRPPGTGNLLKRSTDGQTWQTSQYNANPDDSNTPSADGNGFLIFRTFDILAFIRSTTDGINFNAVNTVNLNGPVMGGNGVLIDCSRTGSILTSTDAINWTPQTLPPQWLTFGPGSGRFLEGINVFFVTNSFFAAPQDQYWTTTNGVSWTRRTFPQVINGGTTLQQGYAFSPTLGLGALCTEDGNIYTSTDAITWTLRATLGTGSRFNTGMVWHNSRARFFCNPGSLPATTALVESTDGVNWTAAPVVNYGGRQILSIDPSTDTILASTSGNGDANTTDQISADGITWTDVIIPAGLFPRFSPSI